MTAKLADIEQTSATLATHETAHQWGLATLGACATAQKEASQMVQLLFRHGQQLESALLDELARRAIAAEDFIEAFGRATHNSWNPIEQLSRIPFEQFWQHLGLATRNDLHALVRKLDQMELSIADLAAELEKTD